MLELLLVLQLGAAEVVMLIAAKLLIGSADLVVAEEIVALWIAVQA